MFNLDDYFLNLSEPNRGCMLSLKDIIISQDENITMHWKYKAPFFYYKNKMFCYLWIDKKTTHPYIGFVEGNRIESHFLEQGNRSRMKILRINPNVDLEVEIIEELLNTALNFYRNGIIKTKNK